MTILIRKVLNYEAVTRLLSDFTGLRYFFRFLYLLLLLQTFPKDYSSYIRLETRIS